MLCIGSTTSDAVSDESSQVVWIVTIPPLEMIISEITGERGEVKSLLQPGASPHTYEPKPSDIKAIERSNAFFYAHESIDGWAAKFQHKNKVEILNMIPDEFILEMLTPCTHHEHHHHHSSNDGHFWHDPVTVEALLPALVDKLSEIDPDGTDIYKVNAERFSKDLVELNMEISAILKDHKGKNVLLFHPAWNYFLNRYELKSAGSIEEFPGREPTPRYIMNLLKTIKEHDVKAIFSEPQLSKSAVETIASETALPVYMIDPLGGYEGRNTYRELMLYNAKVFDKALKGD